MSASPIPLPAHNRVVKVHAPPSSGVATAAWSVLRWAGVLFVVVAGMDLALAWYPFLLGQPEWEFGTITSTLAGMPVLIIGLTLVFAASIAERRPRWTRFIAALFVVLALLLLGLTAIYLTNVPIALQSVADPLVRLGLKKAMVKSIAEGVMYPLFLTFIAVKGWKQASRWT